MTVSEAREQLRIAHEVAASVRRKEREDRRAEEARQIESIKDRLAKEYNIPRNAKFEKCWDLAWDQGHSSGFTEVEGCFRELVDLILP